MKKTLLLLGLTMLILLGGCKKSNDDNSADESPNFVSFADGKIPSSWKTNTWAVDVAMGYDADNHSLRADNPVSSVLTTKTMDNRGYIEFYVRSGENGNFFDFYIDNVKAKAQSSTTEGNWKKWIYTFDKGKHTYRWENTNGAIIHLDAIKFTIPKFMIGDKSQGGIVAYIDNTGEHGIIAAPEDQSAGIRWINRTYSIAGTGTAIGTGQDNTTKIVQIQGDGIYAAQLCDDLVLDGYNDWFLPSKDELKVLYENKNLIGGFTSDYYWSSSEYNKNYVWIQSFDDGYQTKSSNDELYRVRCVREF